MYPRQPLARKRPHQQGFSLIELMVGLVVSMLCMLAIMAAFAVYEGKKRTTTTTNDAQQNGSYAMYVLERQLRTAGASIVQGYNYGVWGCPVTAYTNGTQTLPISGALPAPFKSSGWPASTLLMPVLIAYGGGSTPDTIGVVGGNPAMQVFKIPVTSVPSTNSVAVSNSLGILSGDYVLGVLSNGNCALAHVPAATPTTQVAGTTFTLDTTNSPPNGLQTANYLFDFGSSPAFTLFGIDTSSLNLVSYDLLQRPVNGNAAAVTPLAEGVVQMKALYGVQQAGSSSVQWVQPTGTWSIATLTASASAASNAMKQIKAIRVAIVVQSRLPERSTDYTSGQPTLTLFPDLPSVQYIVTTSTQYRYKVYDTTIPVRNALVAKYY